jgi:SPP1 family predicted phage head-tail adaptor
MPASTIRVGTLRHRAELQRRTTTKSAATGGISEAFVSFATVFANVVPIQGREFFAAAATQAEVTARIQIRYRTDITAGDRVVALGKTWAIQAVIDVDGRQKLLDLMCAEGPTDGR